jgi:hypothetical protein
VLLLLRIAVLVLVLEGNFTLVFDDPDQTSPLRLHDATDSAKRLGQSRRIGGLHESGFSLLTQLVQPPDVRRSVSAHELRAGRFLLRFFVRSGTLALPRPRHESLIALGFRVIRSADQETSSDVHRLVDGDLQRFNRKRRQILADRAQSDVVSDPAGCNRWCAFDTEFHWKYRWDQAGRQSSPILR